MNQPRQLAGVFALCTILAIDSAPAEAAHDAEALALLPEGTAFVLAVDVKRLAKNQLAKDLFAFATRSSDIADVQKRLRAEAGFDLARDVDSVVIGMAGDIKKAEQLVLLARGRFDRAKLTGFLKKDAGSFAHKQHRGISYYTLGDDTEFAFIGSFFVVTPRSGMPKLVDIYRGKATSMRGNRAFMDLLGKGHTSSDLWMAVLMTEAMRREIASETGGHSVDAAVAGIDIAADVKVAVLMNTSDAKAAEALAVLLTGAAKEMAKEPSLQMFGLSGALNKLRVEAADTVVTVDVTIPGTSVQGLLP